MSTDTFGVRIEELEGARATVRVFLVYPEWAYLPRARPFFLMALGGVGAGEGELGRALGSHATDEGFLSTRAADFFASVRELETRNFPLKKKHGLETFHHLTDGGWEREADLPQRLFEVVATDPRWLSHLAPGQTFATTAYELDEAPDTERALARDETAAPYEVELHSAAPVSADDVPKLALAHGLHHPSVARFVAATEGEECVHLDLTVRTVDPQRGVGSDEDFLMRVLAASGAPLEESYPALFEAGPGLRGEPERVLLLDFDYRAAEPPMDLESVRKWSSAAGPRLQLAKPCSSGDAARFASLVPRWLVPDLEAPRVWRAKAWSAYDTGVHPRAPGALGRPRCPIALVPARARLGEGQPTDAEGSPDGVLDGLLYDVAFDQAGRAFVATDRGAFCVTETFDVSAISLPVKRPSVRGFAFAGETTWIASEKGLLRLRGGEVEPPIGKKQGLPANLVVSVAALHDGELLVSTSAGVVAGRPGEWTKLPKPVPKLSTLFAVGGAVWFVGEKSVVHRAADGGLSEYKAAHGVGLVRGCAVQGDTLWLVSQRANGVRQVVRVRPDERKAEPVAFVDPTIAQKSLAVAFLAEALWVGTRSGGFVRFRPGDVPRWFGRARAVEVPSGLGDEIRGIGADPNGERLWVRGIRTLDVVDLVSLDEADAIGGEGMVVPDDALA